MIAPRVRETAALECPRCGAAVHWADTCACYICIDCQSRWARDEVVVVEALESESREPVWIPDGP